MREANLGTSAGEVASSVLALDELQAIGGRLYWVESTAHGPAITSWEPEREPTTHSFPVGSAAHSYGGGSYALNTAGLHAVSKADGQVWSIGGAARVTDRAGQFGGLSAADNCLLAVLDTGDGDHLVEIDTATRRTAVLHRAAFLASPSTSGSRITWAQWPEDAAPWNHCEVWIADYRQGQGITNPTRIAGGPDESAIEPAWSPDGSLYFLSDRTGWWNLYRWTGDHAEPVAPIEADCAAPPWELGYSSYAFLESGRITMLARNGPPARLLIAQPGGDVNEVPMPYTSIKPYLAAVGDRIALIGSSPTTPPEIALIDPDLHGDRTIVRATASQLPLNSTSSAEVHTIGDDSVRITFVWHPPQGHEGGPVPTIIRAHPGPTHHVEMRLDADLWYYTSQGFAVADVDYRGSTGYGREFRQSLYDHWGDYDAADCAHVARWLIESGRAHQNAVFVMGASAGGYTALNAACLPDNPFALAVARSAVVNPVQWARATPRFHRPNAAALGGAPIDPDRVNIPVLLIHGDDDKVVPVDDVVRLAEALVTRASPVDLLRFPDGGHYLSSTAVKAKVLEAEVDAFRRALSSGQQRSA